MLAELLRRFADTETEEEACLGPYIPTEPAGLGGPVRLLGWVAVAAVVGVAGLGGYVAFASFLVDQIVWIGTIAAVLLYLRARAPTSFIGGTLSGRHPPRHALQANLRPAPALARADRGARRPGSCASCSRSSPRCWRSRPGGSIRPTSLVDPRPAFFGFKVGDVTISLSTIALGARDPVPVGIVDHPHRPALARADLPAHDRPRRGPAQLDLDGGRLSSASSLAVAPRLLLSRPRASTRSRSWPARSRSASASACNRSSTTSSRG